MITKQEDHNSESILCSFTAEEVNLMLTSVRLYRKQTEKAIQGLKRKFQDQVELGGKEGRLMMLEMLERELKRLLRNK